MTEEAAAESVADEKIESEVVDKADAESKTPNNEDTEQVSSESESSPKKDGFQKRIDKLTGNLYQVKADRDHWRNIAQAQPESPASVATDEAKTLADFDYDEEKFVKHVQSQAETQSKAVYEKESVRQRKVSREANFRENESRFAGKTEDYRTVAYREMPVSEQMIDVLFSSDKGPEVLYFLGKNDGEAERLSQLPMLEMAREVGKIEANLSKVKPATLSNAPKPTPKIAATDNKVTRSLDDPKLSDREFRKLREKQIANRR